VNQKLIQVNQKNIQVNQKLIQVNQKFIQVNQKLIHLNKNLILLVCAIERMNLNTDPRPLGVVSGTIGARHRCP
jgi:hypothetical protein